MNLRKNFRAMATIVVMLAVIVSAQAQKRGHQKGGNEGAQEQAPASGGVNARIEPIGSAPLISGDYQKIATNQMSKVVFDRFPNSVAEFEKVREQIGKDPAGVVALLVMSYEMYRRDKNVGSQCIQMLVQKVDYNDMVNNKLKNYAKPWTAANFLKGADWKTSFTNLTPPYTIEVRVNPNGKMEDYSEIFNGYYLYVQVYSQTAYDKKILNKEPADKAQNGSWIGVTIVKTKKKDRSDFSNGEYFIFQSCSSTYTSSMFKEPDDADDFKGFK